MIPDSKKTNCHLRRNLLIASGAESEQAIEDQEFD